MKKILAIMVCLLIFPLALRADDIVIPQKAYRYKARLIREARAVWGMGAPVAIFASQIHQESRWDESAESWVGAKGMAQFMPGTADWISGLYPELSENKPLDPRWAIRALVRYDYWLYSRVDSFSLVDYNRFAATLSAYNGGLGGVRKDARLACKHCDPAFWWGCVENYSNRADWAFKENRGYPRRILRTILPVYESAGW